MSKDKYVIVYRDGHVGGRQSREGSDYLLETANEDPDFHGGPAYRIRIREKARKHLTTQYGDPNHWLVRYGEACRKAWTADAV